jgi:hypothetical protein
MAQDIKVENIGLQTCEPTGGFNHRTIKIAPLDWFASLTEPKPICDPTPANEATTFAEMAEITTAHTFNEGYGFMTLRGVQELTDLESTMIGEKRRRLFENKINFTVPGSDSELLGFTRWLKNKDFVCLITEVESGRTRQIGSERMAAALTELVGKIEATMEGDNSQLFTISDKQLYQAPVYSGTITDMPAQT